MMIVSKNSLGQNFPQKIVLNNDTVWVFSVEQTQRLLDITLERNAFKGLSDSLKIDLSTCNSLTAFQREELRIKAQKEALYGSFIEQQLQVNKKLEKANTKSQNQTKAVKIILLITIGLAGGLLIVH